jgi:carotenoid cleavage dioxygenase-like enzyme
MPPKTYPGEVIFIQADATRTKGEDDGYLMVLNYRGDTHTSEVCVFDARDPCKGSMATVRLPHHIPHPFHAQWVPNST